jgi:hypothetical protein
MLQTYNTPGTKNMSAFTYSLPADSSIIIQNKGFSHDE